MLETVIGVLMIVMGIFLIISVLMQSSKNHRVSGSIAGGAETFFGKQKGKTMDAIFNKLTTVITIIFVILAIVLCMVLPSWKEAQIDINLKNLKDEYGFEFKYDSKEDKYLVDTDKDGEFGTAYFDNSGKFVGSDEYPESDITLSTDEEGYLLDENGNRVDLNNDGVVDEADIFVGGSVADDNAGAGDAANEGDAAGAGDAANEGDAASADDTANEGDAAGADDTANEGDAAGADDTANEGDTAGADDTANEGDTAGSEE